jgi:hypothetical protein
MVWYGHEDVVDAWLGPLLEELQGGGGARARACVEGEGPGAGVAVAAAGAAREA